MTAFWLDIAISGGGAIRIVRSRNCARRTLPSPQVAANDNRLPVDATVCRIATELVRDYDEGARRVAFAKTRAAFDADDTHAFRQWRLITHAVETHFAAQCARPARPSLRNMIDRLAQ